MGVLNSSSNSFSYEGLVRISLINKDKKTSFWLKNKGTKLLGDIISRSLIRDSIYRIQDREKPYQLGFVANGVDGMGQSLLRRSVPFSGIVFGDAVNEEAFRELNINTEHIIGKLQLTATITGESAYAQYFGLNGFQLSILDQLGRVLAFISDKNDVLKNTYQALKTQDVLIEWFMLFMNVANEEG